MSKRVSQITTQVLTNGVYHSVDQYNLKGSFPGTGTAMTEVLWLDEIMHNGMGGGGRLALPSLSMTGIRLQNRADYDPNASMTSHNKWRIENLFTESGGHIKVGYSGVDTQCTFGSTPPDHINNPRRCFPQWYTNSSGSSGWSWWHKRVVTQVIESDLVGGSPPITHGYGYSTEGSSTPVVWAHSNGASVWGSSLPTRTWSDWRGYTKVTVTSGPAGGLRSQTDYLYLRGMDGDRASTATATRDVTVTEFNGAAWTDQPQYAGHLLNVVTYDKAGGSRVQVIRNNPTSHITGTRTLTTAWAVPAVHRSYITRTAGSSRWEWVNGAWSARTNTAETWHPTNGRLVNSRDEGNADVAGDEICTRYSYADNPDTHKYDFVSQVQTTRKRCNDTPSLPADLISDERYFYDGLAHGGAPGRGNVTRTEAYVDNRWIIAAQGVSYDPYGRVRSSTDGLNRTTTTAYTNNADGLLSSLKVTNPAGHETSTTLDVQRGAPLTATDANGKTVTGQYDPLGRLIKMWGPGRPTSATPDAEYAYQMTKDAPTWVSTKTLGPAGQQITSYEIYDGALRPRQTQVPTSAGGRAVTDTVYDARGLAVKTSSFYNSAAPAATLVTAADTAVPSQRRVSYDGRGRQVADELWSADVLQHRTTTAYEWDRVTTYPPTGGAVTQDISDDLGRMVEKRQYPGTDLTGEPNITKYGYNLRDELTSVTDPAENSWSYEYDLLGRQIKAVDPDAGTSTRGYDDASQVIRTTDGRGQQLHHTYDALGRKTHTRKDAADGPLLAQWTYDTLQKGQLTSSTRFVDGKEYVSATTGYDDGYRPLGTSITIPAGEGALSGTWSSTMTYKVNGAPATQTYPAAGGLTEETVSYGYDEVGAPTTLTGQDTYVAGTVYDAWGAPTQRTLGAGGKRVRLSVTLDEATRRLARAQTHTENQATANTWDEQLTQDYRYDDAGNVLSIAETDDGAVVSNECFGYDQLRRLTEAWTTTAAACQAAPAAGAVGGPDPYWHSYAYDKVGNRKKETIHGVGGAADSVRDYTYPAAKGPRPHSLSSVTGPAGTDSFGYDDAGSVTKRDLAGKPGQTLAWDAEGNLASLTEGGETTSYLYDADGDRLIRRTAEGSTLYLGAVEIHDTPTGPKCVRYYSHNGSVIASRTTSAELSWHADDHHGTAQLSVAAADLSVQRRKQTPFGQARGAPPAAWPTERGFVGGTQDPTGLVHLGAREYDPAVGRFVSVDPVMDLTDPQQMHGYSYANNNPTTLSDPDGLKPMATNGGHEENEYWKNGGGKGKKLKKDPVTKKWKVVKKKPKPVKPDGGKKGGSKKKATKEKSRSEKDVKEVEQKKQYAQWAAMIDSASAVLGLVLFWCAVCNIAMSAMGVVAGVLFWLAGKTMEAVKAFVGSAFGLLGGVAGKMIANDMSAILLGFEKAWKEVEYFRDGVMRIRYIPTPAKKRISYAIDAIAGGVGSIYNGLAVPNDL